MKPDPDNTEIISIEMPKKCRLANANKRLTIAFKYILRNDKEHKLHKKSMNFGKEGNAHYVDHKDKDLKRKKLNRLTRTHDPFHPNFWKKHILNGPSTSIAQNYCQLITKLYKWNQ